MKKIYCTFLTLIWFVGFNQIHAQETDQIIGSTSQSGFFNSNIDYDIRVSFSIGGTSPLGLPASIREIKKYTPNLQLGVSANATKWLDEKWGLRVGLQVAGKGMGANARVKDYHTEIIQKDSKVPGYFTGIVSTDVRNSYLTLPVSAVYRISPRWNLFAGLYASIAIDRKFKGTVSEGTLRENTPTGTKLTFTDDGEAPFDFSKDQRRFQWGEQVGAEWTVNHHFKLFGQASLGNNNIFRKGFTTLPFSMHNIYLDLGLVFNFGDLKQPFVLSKKK